MARSRIAESSSAVLQEEIATINDPAAAARLERSRRELNEGFLLYLAAQSGAGKASSLSLPDEGAVTEVDLELLSAFLGADEADPAMPPVARDAYLAEPRLVELALGLREAVLKNWEDDKPPLTLRKFYDLAFAQARHVGTSLLLCHNVARSLVRGGQTLRWEKLPPVDAGHYSDGEKEYFAAIRHPDGVLVWPGAEGPSIFFVLFAANQLGREDPADWFRFYATATMTAYSAKRALRRRDGGQTAESRLLAGAIAAGVKALRDVTLRESPAYAGWLWANAQDIAEGIRSDQPAADLRRQSEAHRRGSAFGLEMTGTKPDTTWRWRVPRQASAKDLLDFQRRLAADGAVDPIGSFTADVLRSDGSPLQSSTDVAPVPSSQPRSSGLRFDLVGDLALLSSARFPRR